MSTTSAPWSDGMNPPSSDPISRTLGCDVCVIGGGIAGLTAAYLLADAGKSVVLLEAGRSVGGGETAFPTAHLAWVLDGRRGGTTCTSSPATPAWA